MRRLTGTRSFGACPSFDFLRMAATTHHSDSTESEETREPARFGTIALRGACRTQDTVAFGRVIFSIEDRGSTLATRAGRST